MPPPSFIATVLLAAVVLVLAIARIRSQRKLSNAAKNYQRSQLKLNRTLASLSETVRDSAVSNSSLVDEASALTAESAQPSFAGKCPHCGHSARLASFVVASDSD